MTPAKQIAELRKQIRKHDQLYFVDADPEISDQKYDELIQKLIDLEAANPELVTPDSPTQRVGGKPIEGFRTVEHARPMYSIDKTYDVVALRKWAFRVYSGIDQHFVDIDSRTTALNERELRLKGRRDQESLDIRKQIKNEREKLRQDYETLKETGERVGFPIQGGYFADSKIDGVAVNLRYEFGELVLAATRGDGQRGDDITQNVRAIDKVRRTLTTNSKYPIPAVVEIRGEIFMPLIEFERINSELAASGQEPFANPRNAAAGTIKQLDPNIVRSRRLDIVTHGRGEITDNPFATHSEFLAALAAWEMPTNKYAKKCKNIDDVWQFIESFEGSRDSLPYDVDGVVIRVDRIDLQERLGTTSKHPRWCIAYKYAAEQAKTKLLAIDWQVGKTGKLTPRATMEPVLLAGTTVTHATLHNLGEIHRKDIRVGDVVVIEKAGEIIPQVVRVLAERRAHDVEIVHPPDKCPECGGEVEIDFKEKADAEVESGRFCINPECPAQFRERLIYFVGRNQMRIDGLGEEIIDQLLKRDLVSHFADLYKLSESQLADLTHISVTKKGKEVQVRLGEKKAQQIIAALNESKDRGLARVLASLGIRHIGNQTARVVASNVTDIDELLSSDEDKVRSVVKEGSGKSKLGAVKKAAAAFHAALNSDEGLTLVNQARAVTKTDVSGDEVKAFLDSVPEGKAWGSMKWGNKGGGRKGRVLEHFESLNELCSADVDEFVKVFDDEVVGKSLYEFLDSPRGKDTIDRLRKVGVDLTSHRAQISAASSSLTGKTFVITGTLENYSREEAYERIRSRGGKPTSSVSKTTDFLVVGENPASKLDKAKALGVRIVNEAEFEALIGSE